MAGVRLEKIHKSFGADAVAVRALDLEIAEREFLSLLGPSGCGKTTTLRMLAGLEQPTSGRIFIGGREVTEVAPGRRDIAMVFQSYALYPHMTVGENIAYPLKKRGVPSAERKAMVARTVDLLQLGPLVDRKPRQLSGGQQQRVALGRAIVRDPAVFLLDEPLSNLDAKLRAHMRAELIQLQKRLGKTMVYVTHDQLEAMTMSDRIAIMNKGELQQLGTPDEIYRRPANRFVAGFVGTPAMNFATGRMTVADGRPAFAGAGLTIPLPPGHPVEGEAGAGGRAVEIGIRPEDVVVGEGPFEGRIRVVEPTGHETIVLFAAGDADLVTRVPGGIALKAGEAVRFRVRAENAHLFDQADGRRLGAAAGH
jgi:multiple sugar transport system ATP-binding protein